MKLLFVLYGFVGGGAERVTSIIASGLAERGYDVTLLSYDVPRSYPMSERVKYVYFREGRRLKRRIILFQDIRRTVKKLKPDVAIGILPLFSFWLRMATLGLKVKTIAWDHSSFARCKKPTSDEHFIKYWIYPLFTRTFALTQKDQKIAYFNKNIRVMPNPLTFEPSKQIEEKEPLIIGIGNVSTWRTKGFDYLIKAWAKLQPQHPEWNLLIAGRGDATYLNSLIAELGCKNVTISSFNKDIIDVYKRASIFVLSSRTEGFPMVLLEAMSQGCACVAFDNQGRTEEILGEDAGLLFESGNEEQMTEKTEYFITHPDLRIEYGQKAIERSRLFKTETILDRWEDELKRL